MDFIEQWFGISLDGGSGATELLIIVFVLLIIAVIFGRRWIARKINRSF